MLAELQSAKAFVITVNQGNRKLKRKNKLHKYVCEIHDGSKLAFFFLFVCTCGMWKFSGQGSNPHCYYGSDPSHSDDNTRSLICCPTRELLNWLVELRERQ